MVTDPFPPDLGLEMGKVGADIVTVSHGSRNHSFVSGVTNAPRVVSGPGEYEVADVLIAGVATATEPGRGPTNTAYVLRFDDLSVCHLGDVNNKLTDKQVEALGSIDVLLLPVGGGGALGPTRAAEVAAQLEPALIVPMHYRVDGAIQPTLESVDAFCREVGKKEWAAEPKLTVTRSSLSSDVRIVILEHRRI